MEEFEFFLDLIEFYHSNKRIEVVDGIIISFGALPSISYKYLPEEKERLVVAIQKRNFDIVELEGDGDEERFRFNS